jgi:uncharacterized protein (TIGR02452 family)
MIKRDGVALMNARTHNVSLAKETIQVLKDKKYVALNGNIVDISFALDEAVNNTKLFQNVITDNYQPSNVKLPIVEIVNETTTQAAVRLLADNKKDIVALNFASARNVGGGFLSGAVAQEEDLCRRSGLYACTKRKPVFYNENILCDNSLYTDNIIYSPNVPFFRDENNLFLDNPYYLSIISAPAPNVRSMEDIDDKVLFLILYKRILKILQVARLCSHENIILGAWGCGAFGNDPTMVANAFKQALIDIPYFSYICFAVYDRHEGTPTYNAFKQTIGV